MVLDRLLVSTENLKVHYRGFKHSNAPPFPGVYNGRQVPVVYFQYLHSRPLAFSVRSKKYDPPFFDWMIPYMFLLVDDRKILRSEPLKKKKTLYQKPFGNS